jgi:hypothetical protein
MKAIATAALIAVTALAAAGCASTGHAAKTAIAATPAAATPGPADTGSANCNSSGCPGDAPPAPAPDGTYSGSCDVSLSDALYGQNYLTADVSLHNTGNVGTITRVRVSWGQQGFAPIVATRTVHVRYHGSKTVHLHYPVSQEQISRFQDVQLAEMDSSGNGDGCHYRATNIGTFGAAR